MVEFGLQLQDIHWLVLKQKRCFLAKMSVVGHFTSISTGLIVHIEIVFYFITFDCIVEKGKVFGYNTMYSPAYA